MANEKNRRMLTTFTQAPELKTLFDESEAGLNRYKERHEFLDAQVKKLHKEMEVHRKTYWRNVEKALEARALLPEDYGDGSKYQLQFDAGVLFIQDHNGGDFNPLKMLLQGIMKDH